MSSLLNWWYDLTARESLSDLWTSQYKRETAHVTANPKKYYQAVTCPSIFSYDSWPKVTENPFERVTNQQIDGNNRGSFPVTFVSKPRITVTDPSIFLAFFGSVMDSILENEPGVGDDMKLSSFSRHSMRVTVKNRPTVSKNDLADDGKRYRKTAHLLDGTRS